MPRRGNVVIESSAPQAETESQPIFARSDAGRILVVEDDADIGRLLAINLRDSSFEVDLVNDGLEGFELAIEHDYQLIVLDVMLPGLDGFELCKRLRSRGSTVPILMLTARSSEVERVLGLELGADDYLTKPFSVMELRARIKAILRRVALSAQPREADVESHLTVGEMIIDIAGHQVNIGERALELTAKEFDLLLLFARNPGRAYSRAQLLDQIWGYSHSGYEHTVNTHINRLRNKLEQSPDQPPYIETVWGVGYRFRDAGVG